MLPAKTETLDFLVLLETLLALSPDGPDPDLIDFEENPDLNPGVFTVWFVLPDDIYFLSGEDF